MYNSKFLKANMKSLYILNESMSQNNIIYSKAGFTWHFKGDDILQQPFVLGFFCQCV